MKFLLIGHYCYDVVHGADGTEQELPGGIAHAVAMLSAVGGRNNSIVPIFGVTKDEAGPVGEFLESHAGVTADGLYRVDVPIPRVHYFPGNGKGAVACARDRAPAIPFERIRRHLAGANAVLVNMESGFDIVLETLDQIRMVAREEGIPIHLDMHNLTMGINEQHERVRRPLETWRRWAFMVESVQMNEEEILGLSLEPATEEQTVGHLLTLGVKGVIVTRGPRGATVYIDPHKHLERTDIPAQPLGEGIPELGCGDRLGAAFVYYYQKTRSIPGAAEEAVHALHEAGRPHAAGSRAASEGE